MRGAGRSLAAWCCVVLAASASGAAAADSVRTWSPEPLAGMVLVPAGAFTMGDGAAPCGKSPHRVTLTRGFRLGRREVTNLEYLEAVRWAFDRGYVNATPASVMDGLDEGGVELLDLDNADCEIAFSGGAFALRDAGRGVNADHPVKCVTWYGAARYCDWLSLRAGLPRAYRHDGDWACNGGDPYGAQGFRLPTDAEWEYAAQYDDGRFFPWGDDPPDAGRVNCCWTLGWTTPVGSYADAPEALGLSDMAGNVWEWCNDWHTCDPGRAAVTDPVGPPAGAGRVVRGGSWQRVGPAFLRAARFCGSLEGGSDHFGFRVAVTAAP